MGVLRIILALSVVIAHSSPVFGLRLVNPEPAVQAFFIISGFYMALILNEKYYSNRQFIINRFLKIYPLYFTIIAITILISLFNPLPMLLSYIANYNQLSFSTIIFLILSNIFIFGQDVAMFTMIDSSGNLNFTPDFRNADGMQTNSFLLMPQAWSLSLELIFYLMAPFLVKGKRRMLIITTLIIISLLTRILLYHHGLKTDPWSDRFFPSELLYFIAGILGYFAYKKLENYQYKASLYIFFSFCLISSMFYQYFSNFIKHWHIFYCAIIALSIPAIFEISKNSKADKLIGDLSYPIYISHVLILSIFEKVLPKYGISLVYLGLLTVITSIMFSILLINFIQNPIEKIRVNLPR